MFQAGHGMVAVLFFEAGGSFRISRPAVAVRRLITEDAKSQCPVLETFWQTAEITLCLESSNLGELMMDYRFKIWLLLLLQQAFGLRTMDLDHRQMSKAPDSAFPPLTEVSNVSKSH